ncbi:hypothetical protein O3G_MSEX004038 [Manduca sexta]|uniref:Cytochrome P450 n=1 Tax=Manduca sexta TaxID=7130 RepID=A0A921YU94_MANSE|nr:hypothetical protein O3G_MSEX004038 [Manduca sexta]
MFFLSLLYLLLILFVLIIAMSVFFRLTPEGRMISKIPADRGTPIFHNTFDIVLNPEQLFIYLRKLYRKFNGIYAMRGFGYRNVNIFDPKDVEKILSVTRYNDKRLPYGFLSPWLGTGLLLSNGEKWHERRKMLTPAFHFKILKKFFMIINEQTEELVKAIQEEVQKEKTPVMPLVAKSTLRVICETSMGTSMQEDIQLVTNKYFNAIHKLGKCLIYRISRIWIYDEPIFKLTKCYRIQKAALTDLHKFTKQIIRERRKFRKENKITAFDDDDDVYGKKSRMAMLDLLLDQETVGNIDEEGIREEVDTFMFEGHDTTATALCFMIMRIANEPVVQNLIYEEVQRVLGGSEHSPTMEQLGDMKYLECCIKESLRLYPAVPFISRVVYENVELSGYMVPKSTEINIHIFDIHRLEDIYPEPEKFIPERFLPENSSKRHPYAYIPFSAGARNCIGQKFAMLELKSVMAGIIRRFSLEPVTRPEEIKFAAHLVLRSVNPMYVRFTNRKVAVEN